MGPGQTTERNLRERGPAAVVGLAILVTVVVLGRHGALQSAELAVADRIGRTPRASSALAPPAVVLVSLGEEEFDRFGYPLPDSVLARALVAIEAAGASAIGVDLYRSPPASDDLDASAGRARLAKVVRESPRIVMPELLSAPHSSSSAVAPSVGSLETSDTRGLSAPDFVPAERVGFVNLLVDPGHIVRRGYLYAWDDAGEAHVSFALRLATLHLARLGIVVGPDPADSDAITIGGTPLPPLAPDFGPYVDLDAGGYQIPLDFARPLAAFEAIPLADVLKGATPEGAFRDRVVVVGTDAPSVKDDFDSPGSTASVTGHRLHAQLVDQLIRAGLDGARPPESFPTTAELAFVFGFGLLAIATATLVGRVGVLVPALVAGLTVPFVLAYFGFARGLVLPSVEPALAWSASGGLALALRLRAEARAQRQLSSLFQRFSSSAVADALWRERHTILERGRPRPRRVVLTSLIADLEGFTSAAEKLEPEALLGWIDGYLAAMTQVIEAHGGHVDDFAGDGIKANFGVPIPSEEAEGQARDARQAVAAAIAMGRALADCHRDWAARGLPVARQRIGIFTGPAVVGAVGSDARLKYTSVGDTINVAARLESLPLPEPGPGSRPAGLQRILIGESTRVRIGDAFEVEDIGLHGVKGRSEPLRIFRVSGSA